MRTRGKNEGAADNSDFLPFYVQTRFKNFVTPDIALSSIYECNWGGGGGGGIYRKGTYYTECGEMTDGVDDKTRGLGVFSRRNVLYFSTPRTAFRAFSATELLDIMQRYIILLID